MALDYDQFRRTHRFSSLDGVRGIAAVAVVVFHFGGPSFSWASGWLGVHVFFVLSGFIITTLALREEEQHGRISLRNFYVRRIFRIWPAYLFVLAVLVGLFAARGEFGSREVAQTLPWYLSFNSDLHLGDIFYGHTWTIAIEQRFYLVWPLLAFLPWLPAVRRNRLALLTLVFLVGAALWGIVGSYAVHYLVIAVGCLVAVLMHDRRTYPTVGGLARPFPAALCWTAFAIYHLAVPSLVAAAGGEPLVIMGYGVMVGLILPSLVAWPVLSRIFGSRVMRWWGERSYSLYLVQQVAGWVVATLMPVFGTPRLLSAVAAVLGSAVMADLVYRWVEQPGIRLGRRFVARPGRGRSPALLIAQAGPVPTTAGASRLPLPREVDAPPVGARAG